MAKNSDVSFSDLPPWAQILVAILFGIIMIWAFYGDSISAFWNQYWILIIGLMIFIAIGVLFFYIKIILPINIEVNEKIKKEEKLKKSIIRKRLLKEMSKQLEGLSDEEKEFQINEWVEKEYNKELSRYTYKKDRKKVQPLSENESGKLINAIGNKCENPNCRHTHSLGVHHIIPRSRGGTNKLSNLIVLCPTCHRLADRSAYGGGQLKAWGIWST